MKGSFCNNIFLKRLKNELKYNKVKQCEVENAKEENIDLKEVDISFDHLERVENFRVFF